MTSIAPLKRILFIDDEPALLEGLRRMLRSLRNEWDVQVESSPRAALSRLDREPFDVVVADMRMPALDGVSVLTHVMQKHPDIIRLVLSGQTELESAMRAVPVAHQFLSKPCDAEQLKSTIQRISQMRDRLRDERLRALIGEVDGLPTLPTVCRELTQTLGRENSTIRNVADIVETDPALSAKILQLVNSSFFGSGRRLTHIHDAVSFLGTTMLKNLVTTVTLWREIEAARPNALAQLTRVNGHCQSVAVLARRMLGKDRVRAEEAFAAGLLHDVGVTLLIAYLPEHFDAIAKLAKDTKQSFAAAERSLYEVSHADIGAYLLDAWGLPFSVLEAVLTHHDAPSLAHTRLECADAVFIAQALCKARSQRKPLLECVDAAYLDKLSIRDLFDEWCSWLEQT